MTEANRLHQEMLSALREKRFDRLAIKKLDADYFLAVVVNGRFCVFADHTGKTKYYRHLWQVRSWLEKEIGIAADTVPVETIQT